MSKAANYQSIKREDFMKFMNTEKNKKFQPPNVPSLNDGFDDDDDYDDNMKLQPINIQVLKEMIHKKNQKVTIFNNANKKNSLVSGMRSVPGSSASLKTTNSNN